MQFEFELGWKARNYLSQLQRKSNAWNSHMGGCKGMKYLHWLLISNSFIVIEIDLAVNDTVGFWTPCSYSSTISELVQHVMYQIGDDIRRLHITEFVLSGNVGDAPVNVTVTELGNGEGELCHRQSVWYKLIVSKIKRKEKYDKFEWVTESNTKIWHLRRNLFC